MTKNLSAFQKILEKYKFKSSVPESIQQYVVSSLKPTIKNILRSVDNYSFLYDKVLSVYFQARKMGLRLSIMQSKIVLIFFTFFSMTVIATSIVFALKFMTPKIRESGTLKMKKDYLASSKPKAIEKGKMEKIKKSSIKKKKTEKTLKSKNLDIPKVRLGIGKIEINGTDKNLSSIIRNKLYNQLKNLKGSKRIVFGTKKGEHINRKAFGGISKLGKKLILNIRVVDMEKGSYLFNKTKILKEQTEIDKAIIDISKSISASKEIWIKQ